MTYWNQNPMVNKLQIISDEIIDKTFLNIYFIYLSYIFIFNDIKNKFKIIINFNNQFNKLKIYTYLNSYILFFYF